MVFSQLVTVVAICLSGIWCSASAQSPSGAASLNIESAEIAFASQRDGNWEIYVTDSAGGSQRRLTRRDVQDRFPLWSPDGAQIAFGSQVDSGWELWVMDSSGNRERRLYSQIVAKSARGWSRDGKRLAFAAVADENIDVYTVDVESTQVTRLTSSPGEDRDPSWSPDGTRLAFSSTRDGNAEIYMMRADGSDVRRVTNNSASDASPTWSPDGSAIAFVSDRDGAQDLYVMRPDGQGLTRLTVGAGVTKDVPRWAPDTSASPFRLRAVTTTTWALCGSPTGGGQTLRTLPAMTACTHGRRTGDTSRSFRAATASMVSTQSMLMGSICSDSLRVRHSIRNGSPR